MFVHLDSKQTKVTLFVFSTALDLILQQELAFLLEVLIETKVSLSERRKGPACVCPVYSIMGINVLILFCVD
jgi:hypothetical protein